MNPVAAFLDSAHVSLAERLASWTRSTLASRVPCDEDDAARREARVLLGELGEAGWLDAIGRQDALALCIVRETIAAVSTLADEVVAIQGLGALPLVLEGSDDQRRRWLPGILGGRVMTAFAMTEPEAGSDVASMQASARRDGDWWVLDGDKHLISNAGIADLYLVFASTSPDRASRGITAFLVPAATSGVDFVAAQVMAAPHPLGHVRFRECRVPADSVVGQVDTGFALGMRTLDWLRPTVGAAACGMAARALDEAIAHARRRRQFGQALADMPIVREKIGRMATELDAARLLVYRAAWELAQGAPRISVPAAMAKSFATETAQRIVDEALQICGGVGVLMGHPVERLYRAVRALRIYEGATDILRQVVARGVLESAARS
ncbi:MAG: acyl-CoA dehydrogenase family protein [Acidobacteriota bacterium]